LRLEQLETRLTPSVVLTTLASFDGSNGATPQAGLVMDPSGNLYGTTSATNGTVFELAKGGSTIATLASFNGSNGAVPSVLLLDGSGNLYGTTLRGGTASAGTVFEVAQGSGTITTLASLKGGTIGSPNGVIMDPSGNLFGINNGFPVLGGSAGQGIYELPKGSSTVTELVTFGGDTAGGLLVMDSSGNLYGTKSVNGGTSGAVFELAQGSGTLTPLFTFPPYVFTGGLVMDQSGNLYGTTLQGGTYTSTIFELPKGSSTITTLASVDGSNNAQLQGPLLLDQSGNLYGITAAGGVYGDGSVFMLPRGSSTIETLASFNGTNGADPVAGLIMDGNGNLYGTTQKGGAANDGTIFELSMSGITLLPQTLPAATVEASYSQTLTATGGTGLYTFAVTAGSLPAGLTLSSAGVLSGTPTAAGSSSFTITATDSTGVTGSQGYTLAAYPASFSVSGFPSPTTAGVAGTVTVTALDATGNVVPSYQGTVHLSSSDPQAVLPADYTFTAADQGVHTFTATLKTAGTQSLTATDTANSPTAGSDTGISVTPAATAALVFSNVPGSTTAGSAFTLTLTAKDAYGNTATGYTGTVHFTGSDPKAVLPANYTFTGSDAGQHTFSVTLKTAGSQSVTATDTATSGITGTAGGVVVNPAAAALFILSAPSSVTHGVAFSVTLTVEDAYGNVVTGYRGTVHFKSSDSTATLPANYTFTAADSGVHTFTNAVILRRKGKQTLTVTDTLNSGLTATDTISVL
jgi:uncharacterized repeat protein (TIGR03803 family)